MMYTRCFSVSVAVVAALVAVATAQSTSTTTITTPTTTPSTTNYPRAQSVIRSPLINATFTFEGRQTGAAFEGKVDAVPRTATSYTYHVHEKPVPEDGNCTATGGHLDPFQRKNATCTATTFPDCEVGDLSGKYGKITVTGSEAQPIALPNVVDPTLNMTGENGIIGRSIVVHNAAGARIACANIVALNVSSDNNSTKNGTTSGKPSGTNNNANANTGAGASGAVSLGVDIKLGLTIAVMALAASLS